MQFTRLHWAQSIAGAGGLRGTRHRIDEQSLHGDQAAGALHTFEKGSRRDAARYEQALSAHDLVALELVLQILDPHAPSALALSIVMITGLGGFLPSPGPIVTLRPPSGYGTRWDGGYEAGDEISQYYDNLVGKLICWGSDRERAIARTLRALREFEITGVATTIPADIAILDHADFAALDISTKWVEDVLDLTGVAGPMGSAAPESDEPLMRRDINVEVNGKRFDVSMWVPEAAAVAGPAKPKRRSASAGGGGATAGNGQIAVPMQGTIVKVEVEAGQTVEAGDTVVVLEAMKMENNIATDVAGTVSEVKVAPGDSVGGGDVVVVIDPA